MTRRPSLALLILVAGAFFLIGLYTALLGGPEGGAPAVTQAQSPDSTVEPTEAPARTILIVGVNSLGGQPARLRAVWFLTAHPPADDVFLLGVSPSTEVVGETTGTLADSFALNGDGSPTDTFLQRLYQSVPLDIDEVVVLDELGFARLIDFVGGVSLNDASFTGEAILGVLSLTVDDPEADMQLQRRLLQAMSAGASQLGDSPEITSLVQLMPDHAYSSAELTQLLALLAPVLPLQSDATHIELY